MDSVLKDKSYVFASRVVKLRKYLVRSKKEYVLSAQVLRSGTSVGALIREAQYAQSKKDFINKLSVALKEANETQYWLSLLKDADYITENAHNSLHSDIIELIKLLTSSVNTAKSNSRSSR